MIKGIHAILVIHLTAFTFVTNSLPLKVIGEAEPSVYSPPVRPLVSEWLSQNGGQQLDTMAHLIKFQPHFDPHSSTYAEPIATLTWQLSRPMKIEPGQYVILDCSSLLQPRGYTHMAQEGDERLLNDDGIRSWTISHSPSFTTGAPADTFSITIRRAKLGAITPLLFAFGLTVNQRRDGNVFGDAQLELPMLGIGGESFTTVPPTPVHTLVQSTVVQTPVQPAVGQTSVQPTIEQKQTPLQTDMLFVVAGIGLTPALAYLGSLRPETTVNVSVLISVRTEEIEVIESILQKVLGNRSNVSVLLISSTLISSPKQSQAQSQME